MPNSLCDAIVERYFRELARDTGVSRRLAEELRRLHDESSLNRESVLVALYERLAEEAA
jgi:hypothetical protein